MAEVASGGAMGGGDAGGEGGAEERVILLPRDAALDIKSRRAGAEDEVLGDGAGVAELLRAFEHDAQG